MQRVCYTAWDDSKIVCPPQSGFPLEQFRDLIQRIVRGEPIRLIELKPLVSFLCNDDLIALLDDREQNLVVCSIRPAVNAWLQQQARRIRAKRAAQRNAN